MEQSAIQRWKQWGSRLPKGTDLSNELETVSNQPEEIQDRFYRDLEFGTGGLRGLIGAGTNRMNIYTVSRATQGFSNYLLSGSGPLSVAIAYDSRRGSELFAKTAAQVLAANHIQVYFYKELMPTPALSFAIRYLKCSGGIVITASHNPADYNGYKVYGSDGCQITAKSAGEILEQIQRLDYFQDIRQIDFHSALSSNQIQYIGQEVIDAYIQAVSAQSLCPGHICRDIAIAYTPLNGTGYQCVTRILKENGFSNIKIVTEQAAPDGNFPTCPFPNPELPEAMSLGIKYAKNFGCQLLLATDPDCDRAGIAVQTSEHAYTILTGNETGLLLFNFICQRRKELGTMPANPVAIKTIVTTNLAQKIADRYGVKMINVLTGFKYIGEQIGFLEQQGRAQDYIFGFEESCGYLSGTHVRDKDGVNASLLICEMAAFYLSRGQSLADVLDGLYRDYGYSLNTLKTYTFPGVSGLQSMRQIMEQFRKCPPKTLAGKTVLCISDYQVSIKHYSDGHEEPIHLPVSDVLQFHLEGDISAVIRPSGTEPKIKLYLSVSAPGPAEARILEEHLVKDITSTFHIC